MSNTGRIIYSELIQVFVDTGLPTGNTKPNSIGDPDYIPPSNDFVSCPLPTTTTTSTTTTTTEAPILCIPPVLISLSFLSSGGGGSGSYRVYFDTQGSNVSSITLQMSLDKTTWINNTAGTISPRTITLPSSGLWYVRAISQCTGSGGGSVSVPSNILSVYYKPSVTVPFYPGTHTGTIVSLTSHSFKIPITLSSGLVSGDTLTFQLTSLSSKGATLTIAGTPLTITAYGFLEVSTPITPSHITAGKLEVIVTLPNDTAPSSYVQLLITKLNNIYTLFGTPNATYLETDGSGVVSVTTN